MENNNENNTTELETLTTEGSEQEQQDESLEAESADGESVEADAEGDSEEEVEAAAETKTPAWIDFTAALTAHAQALGLEVQEQVGFTKYINAATGHKLYVAKQGRSVKRVDTTLPILGQDGTYDLSKPNGKIACHVVAELETVTKVLTQLADSSIGKIRAAKRAPKVEAAEAVVAEESMAAESTEEAPATE